ncbi:hypothetical protein ACFYZI_37200 [Streptomyces griseorubiginosus]|uniref:hypothetical protein n=1 Tax=Streptomyces griseorubiginosus TaxID=67304 RepID=UPI0036BEC100
MNDDANGGDVQIGDVVNIHGGSGHIGIVKNHNQNLNNGPVHQQVEFQDLIRAVESLRGRVSADDREVLDGALDAIGTGEPVQPGVLRRALTSIAGVAAVVGDIGVPVGAAVQKVLALLGG